MLSTLLLTLPGTSSAIGLVVKRSLLRLLVSRNHTVPFSHQPGMPTSFRTPLILVAMSGSMGICHFPGYLMPVTPSHRINRKPHLLYSPVSFRATISGVDGTLTYPPSARKAPRTPSSKTKLLKPLRILVGFAPLVTHVQKRRRNKFIAV